jgi:hypothetical protein
VARDGDEVRLRILFATEPEKEQEVREKIRAALSARWELRSSEPAAVRPEETEHVQRLAAG